MNILYAKTILYSYTALEAIAGQIDELVEKKALASMSDTSSALSQCEKILSLTEQKDVLFFIAKTVELVLNKFSESEREYFDYKFFKTRAKDYKWCFEPSSRAYFRKQISLSNKFAKRLELEGLDDKFFENECLKIDFFKELLKRTREYEIMSKKNKPKSEKARLNLKSA